MIKGLDSYVSGRVARTFPIERTPEVQAALAGRKIVSNTWGGYATKLMDQLDIGPEEAVSLLKLTPEMLRDPELQFMPKDRYEGGYTFADYEYLMLSKYRGEAEKDIEPEVRRLVDTVDAVMSGYKVADRDQAQQQAGQLQAEIGTITAGKPGDQLTPQECKRVDLMILERDALQSGVIIGLEEFVTTMLNVSILDPDNPSELAQLWINSLQEAVEIFWQDYRFSDPEIKVGDIIVGEDIFLLMKRNIAGSGRFAEEYAKSAWERIEPVFLAPLLEDLPVIAGTEK